MVLGLPYNHAVDMWSFGCIISELITGTPLFPAINEKELLEFFIIRIGMPPPEMIENCRKRKTFFDPSGKLIRSRVSRIPYNSEPGSDPVRRALNREKDDSLIDFIEVSERPVDRLEMLNSGPGKALYAPGGTIAPMAKRLIRHHTVQPGDIPEKAAVCSGRHRGLLNHK